MACAQHTPFTTVGGYPRIGGRTLSLSALRFEEPKRICICISFGLPTDAAHAVSH